MPRRHDGLCPSGRCQPAPHLVYPHIAGVPRKRIGAMQRSLSMIFEHLDTFGHEQVVFCHNKDAGLKAIIAIHNTVLGPALGGTRMWPYKSERSEEHTSELQSLMRNSYAVFCLK